MGQVAEIFLENPTKSFHIREIARILKLPKTTVSYHVNKLLNECYIIKEKKGPFYSFRANEGKEFFRFFKRQHFLNKLLDVRLVNFLEIKFLSKCIILFGSFAKSEYDKDSDIDIFIQARDKKVDLSKYEGMLKHNINLFIEPDIDKLSPELLNNIANGIKLSGYLKIK